MVAAFRGLGRSLQYEAEDWTFKISWSFFFLFGLFLTSRVFHRRSFKAWIRKLSYLDGRVVGAVAFPVRGRLFNPLL